jgi:mannosylglycerate hydrolase
MSKKLQKKDMKKYTAHIVSHTHWDREWRYPIWETRLMLVDFMDELIEVLESGKYPGFLMDGQVSPVTDYLEIRPDMTDRIKKLVTSGKLQIGPWFYLPDEYPIDGESMIRNLLLGHRIAERLGGVFKVGYTSFGWGQTSQLPQIYAGFGIDVAMVGKRVNNKRAPYSEFLWRSPDSSELLSTRFGKLGRQNFYLRAHLSILFGVTHESTEWNYRWSNGGIAYHCADYQQMEQDHFRLDAPDHWHKEQISPLLLDSTWHSTDESLLENDKLMMNGCDYTAAQPMLPAMLDAINEADSGSGRQWVHTTMAQFVTVMRQKINRSQLVVVDGELRDGPVTHMTGNALATRLSVKRLNKQAQNMLIRFAEPLSVLCTMLGVPYQKSFIDKAWGFLLEASPHDSINGVTQDKTVRDVESRLDQVIEISQVIGNRAIQEIVRRIDMSCFDDNDVVIAVFNSLPYPRRQVIEVWIDMPEENPDKFLIQDPAGLLVYDIDGNAVDCQWQGCSNKVYPVAELHTRAFPYYCKRHRLFFDTGTVPACGYKLFKVENLKYEAALNVQWSGAEARTGTLLTSPISMENKFLRVEMNHNGTFDLTDKRHNHIFKGLNYYEDRGEHGTYWVNKRPMFDQARTSLGCAAEIWSEESGPMQTTLVSRIRICIPTSGDEQQQRRSDAESELIIRTSVTLRAGEEHVEVNVCFENRQENHYLRAMFPTHLTSATHADAGGHFIVDHRPIRPQGPTTNSTWPDMATLPQNNFVDVSDGRFGIAFLNDCLTEYEVLDNKERTVALSFLRSVKNRICTERISSDFPSQKGGQSFGQHRIRYAIRPHSGDWKQANIPLYAEFFNVSCRPVQTRKHKGQLPAKGTSMFEISNPTLRFSAMKKTEDRDTFIIRFYNPTSETQKGLLKFLVPITHAWLTNLNEERLRQIKTVNGGEVSLIAEPAKIVTVEIRLRC